MTDNRKELLDELLGLTEQPETVYGLAQEGRPTIYSHSWPESLWKACAAACLPEDCPAEVREKFKANFFSGVASTMDTLNKAYGSGGEVVFKAFIEGGSRLLKEFAIAGILSQMGGNSRSAANDVTTH